MKMKLTFKEMTMILEALRSQERSLRWGVEEYDEDGKRYINKESEGYPEYEAVLKLISKIESMEV